MMRGIAEKYDVLIAGGGPSGVCAAVGAAQAGASVLLIERDGYLGGEATHSGVGAFCGIYTIGSNPQKCVAGSADQLLDQMEKLQPRSIEWIISAKGNRNVQYKTEYLKVALDDLLERHGVDVLLHTRLIGAERKENNLTNVLCTDDEGCFRIAAVTFVDATGDANLAVFAGAETVWGDGKGNVQAATLPFRLSGVDITQDMSPAAVERAVKAGKAAGIPNLTRERGFIQKMTGSSEVMVLLPSVLPEGLNARNLTKMEQETRKQCISYLEALRRFMPGMEHSELTMIGPTIGFRETRHICGEKILTVDDVLTRRKYVDSVARGGWTAEIHRGVNEAATYLDVPESAYYSIPLGCLCSVDIENLFCCGRNISAESTAMAAARVMGTCFATGQAAGAAAAVMSADPEKRSHPGIYVKAVQEELLRQEALI